MANPRQAGEKALNIIGMKKRVVDRAGLPYGLRVNGLGWRTAHFWGTESRHVPRLLANLNRAGISAPTLPGPSHNAKGARNG